MEAVRKVGFATNHAQPPYVEQAYVSCEVPCECVLCAKQCFERLELETGVEARNDEMPPLAHRKMPFYMLASLVTFSSSQNESASHLWPQATVDKNGFCH